MSPQHMNIPLSRRSIRTRLAYRFLRALKKLNKQRTGAVTSSTSSSIRDTCRRYHMVKMAAYASMASAVGSKRAWSRALLWKIRNRGLNRWLVKRNKSRALRGRSSSNAVERENPSKGSTVGLEEAHQELRKLVPGGEVMDVLSLFDETAHYIKCLTSQVQIMRNIVDFYSA